MPSFLLLLVVFSHQLLAIHVGLYPYIPDTYNNKSTYPLRVSKDLHSLYPSSNFVVNVYADPYDFNGLLSNLTSPEGFDVMEIDSIFLGDLVEYISPWPWNFRIFC